MRGIDVVVNSRVYLGDNHWLLGIAEKLTSETHRKHGTADAILWARKELHRLHQRVTYLEFDNASKLREVNQLKRSAYGLKK